MLQDLFPRHYRHYEGSRFAAELGEFAGWLRQLGYSRHSLRGHLGRLRRVLEGSEHTQPGGTFSETDLREAFAFFSPPADNYRATQRVFGRFLMAMGRLSVAAP